MNKLKNNENGFILPFVLVVIALLAGGVGYLLTQGITELHANVINQDYELCILTGKNALAVVQAELEENINYPGTGGKVPDENGGEYSILITKKTENIRLVDINSQFQSYSEKFVGEIELIPKEDEADKAAVVKFNWKMLGPV